MLNFSAVHILAAISIATIGEGLSSSEPGVRIEAGHRMFTTITGPEACNSSPAPVSLVAEPVTLTVGSELELTDLVVAAYGASGDFIPSVPIEVLERDTRNRILKRDLDDIRYVWIAKEPGTKILLIRDICIGAGGAEADLPITIVQSAS